MIEKKVRKVPSHRLYLQSRQQAAHYPLSLLPPQNLLQVHFV